MKAFIDTSSLMKKYIAEEGAAQFDSFLDQVLEITVSPVYWLEVNSVIARRLKERTLTSVQADRLREEAKKDFAYFRQVAWNEDLERSAVAFIQKYRLKTLDSIQLASAFLARCDVFVTSDKALCNVARKISAHVKFI